MSDIPADDVEALVELFSASQWTELHLVVDGLELTLSNDAAFDRADANHPVAPAGGAVTLGAAPASATPASAPPARGDDEREADPAGLVAIKAPNLGHFYRAPKPGSPPFVEIGAHVGSDDIVCVIEVMKLFTLLTAGVAGIIRRICVADGAMVEFDQPLFYLEPDA